MLTLPEDLSALRHVTTLDLRDLGLRGQLPDDVAGLTALTRIDVSGVRAWGGSGAPGGG
jgi:hypothetical protein